MKTILWIGYIMIAVGLFYFGLPHNIHLESGLDFDLSHEQHITIGLILLAFGGGIIITQKKGKY